MGLTAFLAEIGVRPVLCASGGKSGHFKEAIAEVTGDLLAEPPLVMEGADFYEIAAAAEALAPDLFIGHSKGYQDGQALAGAIDPGGLPHPRPLRRPEDSAPGLPGRPTTCWTLSSTPLSNGSKRLPRSATATYKFRVSVSSFEIEMQTDLNFETKLAESDRTKGF